MYVHPRLRNNAKKAGPSCEICGHALSNPDSITRGIGPECARKMGWSGSVPADPKKRIERGEVYVCESLRAGLQLERLPDGLIKHNVPHFIVYHSPDGYEWGYGGSGPADLALNLSHAVLLALGYKGGMMFGKSKQARKEAERRGNVFALAWAVHHDVKATLIAPVPDEGGTVSWGQLVSVVGGAARAVGVELPGILPVYETLDGGAVPLDTKGFVSLFEEVQP